MRRIPILIGLALCAAGCGGAADVREGRLQHTTDESTGFIAIAPTGRCSILFLLSDEKPRLEDAAALIGARG